MKLELAMVLKLTKSSLYNTVLQSFHNTILHGKTRVRSCINQKNTESMMLHLYMWLAYKNEFLKFYLKYIHCTSPHEKYMYTFKIIINTV